MKKKYHFVYLTTNLVNGKIYVGQHSTDNLEDGYLGSGKYLLKAISKYGRHNFKRIILNFCKDQKVLNRCEEFWIKELNSTPPVGYNISLYVGDIFKIKPQDPRINGKWSQEVKDKMKATWKKKKENGYDIGKHSRGIKKSIEFRKGVSKRMTGGNNPSCKYGAPNKGISWSFEVKEKISKIHKENKTFTGNKNSRYKPIDENLWSIICSDLESGSDIKFVSFLNGVSVDRIIRNLYFRGMILYEDLPNYIRNYTNPESFGMLVI